MALGDTGLLGSHQIRASLVGSALDPRRGVLDVALGARALLDPGFEPAGDRRADTAAPTLVEREWPPVGEVVERRVRDHPTLGRRGGDEVDLEMGRSIRGGAA